MSDYKHLRLALTKPFVCSYLDDQFEQLLVVIDDTQLNPNHFDKLLELGFRRSGNQVYRPHCSDCHECHSLRVIVDQFSPSKNQKRVLKKAKDFSFKVAHKPRKTYYPLYEKYINTRHEGGSMYPANHSQYQSFVACDWLQSIFIELYDDKKLIAVAVTDLLPNALSAVYTFFDPDYEHFSIGTLLILQQVEVAKLNGKNHVYLGYQIDDCDNMNYKHKFKTNEQFIGNAWQIFTK
ncbi:arginyltransferase [Flocculibacter collagenilyticus]|uniref:arginyltransferase n=1 Tax=Flocculibacter collagenilyticus TaxID=2744479 RepID=UPI0018F4D3C4|nr:arginyltransferase [Flocculibacter collagenilyticus]